MDSSILDLTSLIGGLGVGGVLGLVIFLMYRKDSCRHQKMLEQLLKETHKAIRSNTRALGILNTTCKKMNNKK